MRPETPQERRARELLQQDVEDSPLRGRRLEQRLRNFRPNADSYLAALGGPLPYMRRLKAIHAETEQHELQLAEAYATLAEESGDDDSFARRWRELAESWNFAEVNRLIEAHNRWYPVESRLPMDPKTGDYVLVDGRRYTYLPLDADWVLARFPAAPARAVA